MDFWPAMGAGFVGLLARSVRTTLVAAAVLSAIGYAVAGWEGVRNGLPWSLVAGFAAFVGALAAIVVDVQDREGPELALDDWNGEG